MMAFFRICVIFLLIFFSNSKSKSDVIPMCKFEENYLTNLKRIYDESDRIALYSVQRVKKIDGKSIRNGFLDLFEYELSLSRPIKGDASDKLFLPGIKPHDMVPAYYFDIRTEHMSMVRRDDYSNGVSIYTKDDQDGECKMFVSSLEGYYVLYIEGLDTPISRQPVVSLRHDPLILKLIEISREGD